ncbi:ribonuclease H [Trichonephila clavipes]|nr:ribonuclease H [Trichonephila clavipes]
MEDGVVRASRRLDFYLLVHGRYFISLLPPVETTEGVPLSATWGTHSLGVTGSLLSSIGETLPLLRSPTNYDVTRRITSPPEYSMSGHIRRDLKDHQRYNLNEDIRIRINLEHSILNFMQEPPFPRRPPKTKITLNLLRPCSRKEDARILKQKGLETIEKISQENFAIAYTDGSSEISLHKGGAGILFQLPNKERKMHKINNGLIASNFTSELLAIKEALILYSTHLELSGTTEGLAIFSDSRAALEAIIKGEIRT